MRASPESTASVPLAWDLGPVRGAGELGALARRLTLHGSRVLHGRVGSQWQGDGVAGGTPSVAPQPSVGLTRPDAGQSGNLDLLFLPRDLHAWAGLPDEHVALRQVCAVQLPRRMRLRTPARTAPASAAVGDGPTARRSAASSPSEELTNIRRRWSGVRLTTLTFSPR
jgi:hypothetical protein